MRAWGLATLAMFVACAAQAHSHKVGKIEIVHPWCIEHEDLSKPVAVFMTIRNSAKRPDRLLRVSTSIARKSELRAAGAGPALAAVEVGSRGEVNLKHDGPHVLLSGVRKELGVYDSFLMTLVFERAGRIEVEVMVEKASVLEPASKEEKRSRNDGAPHTH